MIYMTNDDHQKIVLFIFAGRQKYMDLQTPYLARILRSFPASELHIWNFSRNDHDNAYLQSLPEKLPRTRVFNEYYAGRNEITTCTKSVGVICSCTKCRVGNWSEPYKYYASRDGEEKTIYVKIDDDILYIDTSRFSVFIDSIKANQKNIISANVMNNGICAILNDEVRNFVSHHQLARKENFESWWFLCTKVDYFRFAHLHFLEKKNILIREKLELVSIPRSRFSINTLGFNHEIMQHIANQLGVEASMNDEHIISTSCDILILKGFVTSHFHYSDQRSAINEVEEDYFLDNYRLLSASQGEDSSGEERL